MAIGICSRLIDYIRTRTKDVHDRVNNHLQVNDLAYFNFSVLRCLLKYYFVNYITVETACAELLLFSSYFFLKTLSLSSFYKVVSGQLFWIVGAYILKDRFTTSIVMSIIITFDPDNSNFQNNLLNAHTFVFVLGYIAKAADSLYIIVALITGVFWYSFRYEGRSSIDILLAVVLIHTLWMCSERQVYLTKMIMVLFAWSIYVATKIIS